MEVQEIFESNEFNDSDIYELKEEYGDNEEIIKELNILKEIHKFMKDEIFLDNSFLDSRGNRTKGWAEEEKRGGHKYYPPLGWIGFGVNIYDKYDNKYWVSSDNNKNEWAVAYHGVGRNQCSDNVKKIIKLILEGGLKPGSGQALKNEDDVMHPGKKIGIGVYCQPDPKIMEKYAGSVDINGTDYLVALMLRVKPNRIRCSSKKKDLWVLSGDFSEMRPYRILFKKKEKSYSLNKNFYLSNIKESLLNSVAENEKKNKRNNVKKEIIKRQINLKNKSEKINYNYNSNYNNNYNYYNNYNYKKDKLKQTLEDMCIMGSILKEEIIETKKTNPQAFVPIKEATKDKYCDIFCLGLLAQFLEDNGVTTVIERDECNNDNDESVTILQFIMNGMIEKKKYSMTFDFGDKRNNELLNNKYEQEKFHNKLRKKLSLEFNVPEDDIILTYPQKGSYNIQLIFQSNEFNELNLDVFKQKFKDDKELCYLKEINTSLIMDGCKLNKNMLDNNGNRVTGWGVGEKRGGYNYYPPLDNWMGFGLKVTGKYDNGNDEWLACDGNKNEWAVAYHGVRTKMKKNDGSNYTLEEAVRNIYIGGFKKGGAQVHQYKKDLKHKDKIVGEGIYCSPNPKVLEQYASYSRSHTIINGKRYMMGFMMRVKPDKIRISSSEPDYWVLNPTNDEIRPYRILVKEN